MSEAARPGSSAAEESATGAKARPVGLGRVLMLAGVIPALVLASALLAVSVPPLGRLIAGSPAVIVFLVAVTAVVLVRAVRASSTRSR